ncbi:MULTISPECIES: SDR family oxidoreductase [unclassified Actinopolyspora]|uniref:SDR family oxidoreductase n=1 Tax=unclassified Actinopolyspora TaxID=2639451 RepID=UPI0013F5E7DB|nr:MULTISPECIES: SDR family oxidoreductase [unclassified Actinopolyspora]NHD15910.1 SDR family oxidoreductase [Actinopolyspora sp. BKK2]NHE74876.1 SDR family oxidoreductase [Actinopolyspora sp. BKK1]
MRIAIAGGHGKIALRLTELLARRGEEVLGLIRQPDQAADLETAGSRPVPLDLERSSGADTAEVLRGTDAVVFAAGAGPGSGADRKYSLDLAGSVLLAEAAERAGVPRFVQISTIGAGQPPAPDAGEIWQAYIDAKTRAEQDLRSRSLDWTIVRPGRLTDAEAAGLVQLSPPPVTPGSVPRRDVAAVLAELLTRPGGSGLTLELIEGSTSIPEAVDALGTAHRPGSAPPHD